MKIGDKVNFLTSQGGGIVAGFQGKNIVLVEDEDGFQIPTTISDVVVVSSAEDYETSRVVSNKIAASTPGKSYTSAKALMNDTEDEEEKPDFDPADKPVTFKAKAEERKGGDKVSCSLAFVPSNVKDLTHAHFECYFVNDSNYYLRFTYLTQDSGCCHLRHTDEVEPNTLVFLEDVTYADLNDIARINIQLLAYKTEKTFLQKPAYDVNIRIDGTKFYKLHSFVENPFFESEALLFPIVEDDKSLSPIIPVKEGTLKENIFNGAFSNSESPSQKEESSYVRRYDDGKKGNPFAPKHKENEIVVDLHATALLETTAGMKSKDILEYQLDTFRKTLDAYHKKRGTRIVFIHGKGEGVLRQTIISELKHRFKNTTYQDASFQEYGYGATMVTIR